MKLKHWLIVGGVVLFFVMFGIMTIQREIIRIRTTESNARLEAFREFRSELKTQRLKDSTEMAELKAMQLSKSEIRSLFPNIEDRLNAVDKKLSKVESIIEVGSKTEVHIKTYLRDSTIFDTTKVKVFSHLDSWIDLSGIVYENDIHLDWSTWDTLNLFLDRGRGTKKFIFEGWRYGPKEFPLTIKNTNPHNSLFHAKYLRVRNKKDNGK